MDRLKNKVALITGGATGIGRSTALLFGEEGAKVIIVTDRATEDGEKTAKEICDKGGEAIFVKADVANAGDAQRAINASIKNFGKLNILFNNAGIWIEKEVVDMLEEEWDKTLAVNLKGVFLFSKAAIPEIIKAGGGSIINTSSSFGHVGSAGGGAYCASKAGVLLLTKVMAIELAKYNIRVNCISPGEIVTPMHIRWLGGSEEIVKNIFKKPAEPKMGQLFTETKEEKTVLEQHPIGRFGSPAEVADCVLFLASNESGFATGSSLAVDGGYTAV